MFDKLKSQMEKLNLSVESENLAMPEIHVKDCHVKDNRPEETGKETESKTTSMPEQKNEKPALPMQGVLGAIFNRCSVRSFADQPVSNEEIRLILAAGMSGPTGTNARDWSFLVVNDKAVAEKLAEMKPASADTLREAAFCILVCGDLEKACPDIKDFWVADGSIAAQNMMLAAKGLGIGSVWLSVWPQNEVMKEVSKLFALPATQVPLALIAFGYPNGDANQTRETWDESIIHYNKW